MNTTDSRHVGISFIDFTVKGLSWVIVMVVVVLFFKLKYEVLLHFMSFLFPTQTIFLDLQVLNRYIFGFFTNMIFSQSFCCEMRICCYWNTTSRVLYRRSIFLVAVIINCLHIPPHNQETCSTAHEEPEQPSCQANFA